MDSNDDGRYEENGDSPRNTLMAKCVMRTITHPLDYARFLVQVSFTKYLCNINIVLVTPYCITYC